MILREATSVLERLKKSFKAVALTGPRQSGKTTLAKTLFADKTYISLENPVEIESALRDPVQFLNRFPQGAILDEVQRAPQLFSYLQQILDESDQNGLFVLSGSNNFLLLESITQSLAGRVGYLELLPFNIEEAKRCPDPPKNWSEAIFAGGYPPILYNKSEPSLWFSGYVRTYIERDVRQIKNISGLMQFQRLLSLCAARVGQQVNMSSLSIEIGVDYKTIQSWLGVMQASYIIFLLPPYYKNFNKRIVKTPKLYFYDTGLVSYLLGITEPSQLYIHPYKGALFENFVVSELLKNRFNKGKRSNLYYYRDSAGNEVDIIIEKSINELQAIEIKSGETVQPDLFRNLSYWEKLTGHKNGLLIFAGVSNGLKYNAYDVVSWGEVGRI